MNYRLIYKILFTSILALSSCLLHAQLKGRVTNNEGEALAFANIYIEGTTTGTTTNEDGFYTLSLAEGKYHIVYQYIGYQEKSIHLEIGKQAIEKNVQLAKQSVNLSEVVVSASAEDPAYAIIRQAIKKRRYYKKLVSTYECDVYIKGNHRLISSPEKVFGKKVGSMGGVLDSTGRGIVYLSESQSRYYKQKPSRDKEIMYSARVSGSDNGFGFNRASLMDFDLYNNHVFIERAILSPIANNAMLYYDYKLIGTFTDKQNHSIHKIKLLPKREADPSFGGYIYIVEDLWNIQGVELTLTGEAIMQPLLDTLRITQLHIPVADPNIWMQISQKLDFEFGVMGFHFKGYFTGVFSDYKINQPYEKSFFNPEVLKINKGANEKDIQYWDSIRPIPLTQEEVKDYHTKDSLKAHWTSESFLDSLDRRNNKFTLLNAWLGYTYRNTYKGHKFYINSPIASFLFNPIQGDHMRLEVSYKKRLAEFNMKYYKIGLDLQYGLADKRFRGGVKFDYNFNKTHFTKLSVRAGYLTRQFNQNDYVYEYFSSTASKLQHKNYIHFYDRNFAAFTLEHELINGIFFRGGLEYEDRSYLENNSEKSFFFKDRRYLPNNSVLPETGTGAIATPHQALILNASFRIRFRQRYLTYPQRKYIIDSKFPTIWLHYQKGIPVFGSDADFDEISISIDDEQPLGLFGHLEYSLSGGFFLRKHNLRFMDYKHFKGNRFWITEPHKYYDMFFLLPYYEYSTDQAWLRTHVHHSFEGFILDKIPLINRLNWKLVSSFGGLYVQDKAFYHEWTIGIDNLGIGPLRLFRIDFTTAFKGSHFAHRGVSFGVTLPFE